MRVIGREAFYRCVSLRKAKFPNSIEEIGLDAFRESGLENFTAPTSLRAIM